MSNAPRSDRGFAFVAVLCVLVIVSLGLAAVGPLWSHEVKRERELELLRVGRLYSQAFESYYAAAPGSTKQFPSKLEDLLADYRFVGVKRHMRRLYGDPVNPGQDWGLVRDKDGRIAGIYSRSTQAPLARATGAADGSVLPNRRYSDWKFTARKSP